MLADDLLNPHLHAGSASLRNQLQFETAFTLLLEIPLVLELAMLLDSWNLIQLVALLELLELCSNSPSLDCSLVYLILLLLAGLGLSFQLVCAFLYYVLFSNQSGCRSH